MGEIQWEPTKRIAFNTDGSHGLSGRRRICTVNFEGSSPFRGYESTTAKVTYNNDGVTVNTDVETMWNRNKITSSLSVSKRIQLFNKSLEGKFSFTSPFRNYENVQVSTFFDMNEDSYKVNIDTQLPHRSTASFNSQGKMSNWNDIEVNAVVIGNFPRYMDAQKASIDFVHKLKDAKLRTTVDTSYGNDRLTVVLIGLTESGYNSRNSEFSFTVNTPFRGYEELKADFGHNQRGYEYLTKLQMNKNKLSGSLTHKLNIRDALNFDTVLELASTSSIPNGKISIVQSSNGRQLEHTSFVQWDKNNKIHLNAHYLDKVFLKEILVKLSTPYRDYKELEMKASMECQDWEHKGALSFVWNRRNKMTLSAVARNYRWESLDSTVEFTSPFRGYEYYSATVKYDLTDPQKKAEASFLWDVTNRKSIVAKGNLLYSSRLSSLDLSLTTPFSDFERVAFTTKYEGSDTQQNLNVLYERGWRRINLSGRSIIRTNDAEINVDFSSPYRTLQELSASAKYSKIRYGMTGEASVQWNRNNKYKTNVEYELRGSSGKGSIEVLTPINNFRKVNLDTKGSYSRSAMEYEVSLGWNDNQKIVLNYDLTKNREESEMNIKFLSPFAEYREIIGKSSYKWRSGHYEHDVKLSVNQDKIYEGSFVGKYGGDHLAEIRMKLNSPVRPLRDVQLSLTVDLNSELFQLISTLKCENENADIELLLNKKMGQFYEGKLNVNTPFEGFKSLSFYSSLRNDRNQFIDGQLKIVTPFEMLKNFNAYCEFKSDDEGYKVNLKADTPNKNANILGKLSNSQFKPFLASLEIEAPFTSFKSVSTNVELNMMKWNNMDAKWIMNSGKFSHGLDAKFFQENDMLEVKLSAQSTSLRSKSAVVSVTADYKDLNRISTEASIEVFGNVHYMNGQFKSSGKMSEFETKMESSLLPEREAKITAKLSRRRNDRVLEAEINAMFAGNAHELTAKYENKGNQVSANAKIDSNMLSFSTLESEAKYINSNGRDMEASFSVSTPYTSHTFKSSLKNYEGEKIAQMKIECPMVSFLNPFTITSTFKHEGYSSMDLSLSVSTPGKEIRVTGNMKNNGWQNAEAFFVINTPYDALRMVRVDGRFSNDRYQNIDANFQIGTSYDNFPSLGVTSKLSRTEGSEEMSLMLRLPLRNYRSVQLLGNVHYDPDYSSADSRITFTLPKSKYVVYGQYGLSRSRISGRGEVEFNNQKWSATGRLERNSENKDVSLSISTPSSQTYTFGGAYGSSGNRQNFAMTYSSPSNERYSWNSTLNYENIGSFSLDFQAESPFYNYRTISGIINQQSNSNSFSTNVEYIKNGRKGFVKAFHRKQRDGLKGSVQMGCPYTKDLKLSYSRVKKYTNIEDSVEFDYNRAKQFKMEVILFGEKSSHIVLDVPVLPLTVTADSKKISNGREFNFRSNYFSRVVSFRTSHQWDSRQILHDAAFSWDERAEKRISYDFKLAKTETGRELYGRLDTPLRSLMLKGNFTKTNLASSGGIDFCWDAARSMEKHIAIGVLHADISTDSKTSHKLEIVMEHPKLSKDIVQTNIITYSPNEVHVKSKFQYSRERRHDLLMELTATDVSKNYRDTHYKAEFFLRHPASNMDIRAAGEAMNTRFESTAYLRLNSLDRHQAQNVRELKAKIMKLRQEIEMMVRSNDDQMKVLGKVSGRNGEYDITLDRMTNEQKDLSTRITYSRRNSAVDISVMNTENTGVQISASFPKESASLKIAHSKRGNQMTDASVFLGLEGSKVLKSKINWRPKMLKDLRINFGETLRGVLSSNKARYETWSSNIAEELSTRATIMSRVMSDLLAPFIEDLKNGVSGIGDDLSSAKESAKSMYYRNEFHMRDIVAEVHIMKVVASDVANGLALGFEVLYNITVENVEDLYYTLYYTCVDYCDYMYKVRTEMMWKAEKYLQSARKYLNKAMVICAMKIDEALERASAAFDRWSDVVVLKFDKWLRSYAPCIIDGYYYTKNAADRIRYSINELSDCVVTNRYYIALTNYATSVANTFKVLRDYEYAETTRYIVNRLYDINFLDSIMNHPTVDKISEVANSALRKSVEVYHNLGMDVVLAHAADAASDYLQKLAFSAAQEYFSEFYQTKAGAKYDFEPERGHIALEVTLPVERESLADLFDYESYPEYKQVMNVNHMAMEYYEDFCFWDFYYKFMKYFTPSYWLQPSVLML
ncbi:apolipophorin [Caerostris extrusa]|uniref:Apolipophorin n=1 Tax=Caerostris extrusa TaxID=172846 RepID=A0AAV4T1N5_CAEEX|nr:apolipophorin [Caerostris extrusa]